MNKIKKKNIESFIQKLFKKLKVNNKISECAIDGIIHTSLRGIDTHGLSLLYHYVKGIQGGRINTKPKLKFISEFQSISILDADHTIGHAAGYYAMQKAIKLASKNGIGSVAVKNSSHCGALSFFGEMAAKNNMIGLAFTHATAKLKSTNSNREFFGTNPICFAAPTNLNANFCFDSSQSFMSFHEILKRRKTKKILPNYVAADINGKITNNPQKAIQLLPIGDYKGMGMAMMVDILCSLLTGMNYGPRISKMYSPYNEKRNLGHFFIAININAFENIKKFKDRLTDMCIELKKTNTKNSIVFYPGEKENIFYKKRIKDGIPINKSDKNNLINLSKEFKINIKFN